MNGELYGYLTHSIYGRNGTEIKTNNNGLTYYTGGGAGSAYTTNTEQSSTGNVTGIYDLSGNAYEFVAAFNSAYNDSGTGFFKGTGSVNTEGTHFASYGGTSTKYATAYSNSTSTYSDNFAVGEVSKIGDAIQEVYVSSARGWFSDDSYFVGSGYPFFVRSGYYDSGAIAGIFYSGGNYGNAAGYLSFRVVLIPD